MEPAGKTAFITGGASGLGLAVARNFLAAGANVMLFDRNEELLRQASAELGGQAIWHAGDVTVKISFPRHRRDPRTLRGHPYQCQFRRLRPPHAPWGRNGPMPLERFEHSCG